MVCCLQMTVLCVSFTAHVTRANVVATCKNALGSYILHGYFGSKISMQDEVLTTQSLTLSLASYVEMFSEKKSQLDSCRLCRSVV